MVMFGVPVALVVLTFAAAAQRAPSPEEQRAFVEGLRLFEAGDARGAERVWKAGYAAGHDPAFLVRIGEAQEKAGAPKQAAESYEQYLRESPDAADREEIEARIRRLGPSSSAKSSLRGQDRGQGEGDHETPGEMYPPGAAPAPVPVPVPTQGPAGSGPAASTPSQTTPANAAPGGTGTGAGAGTERAGPSAQNRPERGQASHAQVRDDSDDDLGLIENDVPRSRLNGVAWIATGVTALLLGVAAFYGASAAEKAGDANRLLTYADQTTSVPQEYALHAAQYEEDVRLGRRDDRLAKGFAIAAGVTAVAAAVLFITDSRSETAPVAGKPRAPTANPRRFAATPGLDVRPRAGTSLGMDLSFSWSF
jgi:hypothetical protein